MTEETLDDIQVKSAFIGDSTINTTVSTVPIAPSKVAQASFFYLPIIILIIATESAIQSNFNP